MKKSQKCILSILAAAAMTCGAALPQNTPFSLLRPALTAAAEDDAADFVYEDGENGVRITGWNGTGTTVKVPEKINGVPVTEIAGWVFFDQDKLTEVILPDTVTFIGNSAFNSCKRLTQFDFPDSLKTIEASAFTSCEALTSVDIPDGVTEIMTGAFSSCKALSNVSIPESVTFIGGRAFSDTQWLSDKQAESPFVTVNHILIDASTCSGDVTVPNDVNYIADSAFSSCRTVTGVVIQNGVTGIGESAFVYCSMLSSISIPDSVTFISASAFSNCTSLTEIEIPDSVTTIDGRTFFYCEKLISVKLPAGLDKIGDGTFQSCTALKDIVIPDSVKSIGMQAFTSCSSLTEIVIPDGVQSIGMMAFAGCSGLTELNIPDSVTQIGTMAFSNSPNLVISGNPGSAAEQYALKFQQAYSAFSDISLTLSDDLGLNFCVRGLTAENAADYKVVFSGKCDEADADTALKEKQGRYCATANVSADCMGEEITAKLYKLVDEQWKPLSEQSYSVNRYLENVQPEESWSSEKAAAFENLKNTVKRYGEVSYAYFNTLDEMPEVTNYMAKINAVDSAGKPLFAPDFESSDATIALVLNAKLAARLYIRNLTEGAEAKLGTETLTAKKAANGKWYFQADGIKPTQLADRITITYAGVSYSFSPLSWSCRVMNADGAPAMDTAMANILYEYYQNASLFVQS